MPVTQFAFYVDSETCSGCKTCQVACQDRHDLEPRAGWRRVIEITAGGWHQTAGVWTADVVAYYLSVACHHCLTPVCGQQCSTEAIWKRSDGIVLIDGSRCTKCRKCQHDCPYDAIRWDAAAELPRKCDFCLQDLDAGRPPACVAACPNGALGFGERTDLQQRFGGTSRVFPLPDPGATGPALVIRPHRDAARAAVRSPRVANWDEL